MFKTYIEILFPLKDNKVNKAKDILNILWGALCEVDKRKQFVVDTFKIDEDEEILELYPSTDCDNVHIIKTSKMNKLYKTTFARLNPFLTSQARRMMCNIMYDEREHIQRILTDGFLTDKKIHQNIDVKLGELKYEGYTEKGLIKNCINKVEVHY